jgi:hypothetical protein
MHWLMDITKEQLQDVIRTAKRSYKPHNLSNLTDVRIIEKLFNNEVNLHYVCKSMNEQFPAICIAAVKQDVSGKALKCVKKQTPEICLAAVQQDGHALQYVKEQTPEICLAAVQQDGHALQYVKDQTPEICITAVKQYGWVLRYVKEQTLEICMVAVQRHGWALKYVREQTPEMCMAAVKQSHPMSCTYKHIKDPVLKEEFKTWGVKKCIG